MIYEAVTPGGLVCQGCHKPKQLNDGELKRLIFNHTRVADDCFLFVVDTARGKILYVSESVNQVSVVPPSIAKNCLPLKSYNKPLQFI